VHYELNAEGVGNLTITPEAFSNSTHYAGGVANFKHYAEGVGNLTITPEAFANSTHYAGGVG
jgi:hypothetical protein